MAYVRKFKRFARRALRAGVRAGAAYVRKRYTTKKGKVAYGKIARDVYRLKNIINSEKHRFEMNQTGLTLGSVDYNSNGFLAFDITPNPSEGTTYGARIGSSIKISASHLQLQIFDQANKLQDMKVKMMIVVNKGEPVAANNFVANTFNNNTFIGGGGTVIDYNSAFNPDNYGKFTIVRQKTIFMKGRQLSDATALNVRDISIGTKYFRGKGHHVRYAGDTTTIKNGQVLLLFFADSGNKNTSNISTLSNVPVTAIKTGVTMNYNLIHYYYDN